MITSTNLRKDRTVNTEHQDSWSSYSNCLPWASSKGTDKPTRARRSVRHYM